MRKRWKKDQLWL